MYDTDSVDEQFDFPEDFKMDKDVQRPDVLEMVKLEATERKRGRPKKLEKCVPVPISMPPKLLEELDLKHGGNRSKFVCDAVREKLEK